MKTPALPDLRGLLGVLLTVTGRAAQQRYVNGGQKNTAWVLSSPLDWETVEGYFPVP